METKLDKYQAAVQEIYAIESVDIRTVRPLGMRKPIAQKMVAPKQQHNRALLRPPQMEFDFGAGFREWMSSFSLKEPIAVLILSLQATEALLQQGKRTLGDLIEMERGGVVLGIGQGHLDEIYQKLHEYIKGQNLFHATTLDISSLLRSSLATMKRDKMYLLLDEEKLTSIMLWTDAEKMGMKHLKTQEREEILHAARLEFSASAEIAEALRIVCETFVVPWIQRRHDLATEEEISERLELVSEDPNLHRKSFSFIQRICFKNRFPLHDYLIPVEKGLYTSTQDTATYFHRTKQQMQSYFYAPGLKYSLTALVGYIERENGKMWENTPKGWVASVAKKSNYFSVRKSQTGELQVSIA